MIWGRGIHFTMFWVVLIDYAMFGLVPVDSSCYTSFLLLEDTAFPQPDYVYI